MSTTTANADTYSQLMDKIENRTAVCGIIGLGYVGLPLAGALHDAGFPVLGFDVDPRKITMLNSGESYLKHLGEQLATGLSESDRFEPTADFSRLGECDVVIVCVPTHAPQGPAHLARIDDLPAHHARRLPARDA